MYSELVSRPELSVLVGLGFSVLGFSVLAVLLPHLLHLFFLLRSQQSHHLFVGLLVQFLQLGLLIGVAQ